MPPKKEVELKYDSYDQIENTMEILLNILGNPDATVAAELEGILAQYGLELKYDLTLKKAQLYVDLSENKGMTVAGALEKVKNIAFENPADNADKIEVKITPMTSAPVGTLQNIGRANMGAIGNRLTNIRLKALDRVMNTKQSEEFRYKKNVEHFIEETRSAGNLDVLIERGVDEADIDDMILQLGLGGSTEDNIVYLLKIVESASTEFAPTTTEHVALEVIIRKVLYVLFKNFRLTQVKDAVTDGTSIDYRKLDSNSFEILTKNLVGDNIVEEEPGVIRERRIFYAEVLRDIFNFEPTLAADHKDLIRILAFPMEISPIETGVMPTDRLMLFVEEINTGKLKPEDLAEFFNLPNSDPRVIEIFRNLKVLIVLKISRETLSDIIFKKDLSINDPKDIIDRLFKLIRISIPDTLARNYGSQKNSLLLGETLSYLEYIYSSSTDVILIQQRDSFLDEFVKINVPLNTTSDKLEEAVLLLIQQLMDSPNIMRFDKKKNDEYKMGLVSESLTGSATLPTTVNAFPELTALTPTGERIFGQLDLLVTTTGVNRDAGNVLIGTEGSMPALIELFLDKPDILNAQTNLYVLRESLAKLKNLLERKGIYQYLVTLLQNSDDSQANQEKIFDCIYNSKPPISLYLEAVQKFIEKFIPNSIILGNKGDAAKYLASKLIVDVLIIRTTKDEMTSRLAYQNATTNFGAVDELQLTPKVEALIKPLLRSNGRIDLSGLDREQIDELVRELKSAQLRLEIINVLKNAHGILNPDQMNDLINGVVDVYVIRERGNINGLKRKFRKEVEDFIHIITVPPINPATGLNINADQEEQGLKKEESNLHIIIGRSVETHSIQDSKVYENLKQISRDIKVFLVEYEEAIRQEKVDFSNVQIERGMAEFAIDENEYIQKRLDELRPTAVPPYLDNLRNKIGKIKNKNLMAFINSRFVSLGAVSQDDYLNALVFIEIIDGDNNFNERDLRLLFGLITTLASRQPFNIATMTVDGTIYNNPEILLIGSKLLKYLLAKAMFEAQNYNLEFEDVEKLSKKVQKAQPKAVVTTTPVPAKVSVGGKTIKSKNREPIAVRIAKKVVNKKTILGAGTAAIGVGSVVTGTAPVVFGLSTIAGSLGGISKLSQRRNGILLTDSQENKTLLMEDMRRMPQVVQRHTMNLLRMNAAGEQLERAQRDINKINYEIYPRIQNELSSKDKKNRPEKVTLQIVPYLNRQIDSAMNELNNLLELSASKQINPEDIERRISELIRTINDLMNRIIQQLENDILSHKLNNVLKPDLQDLRDLEKNYSRGRFLRNAA